jgi:hypothetical protein
LSLLSTEEIWDLIVKREAMLWRHIHKRITFLPPGVEKEDVLSEARLRMSKMLRNWDPGRSPHGDMKLYANQCAGWSVGLAISDVIPANEGRYGALDRVCRRAWDRFVEREGRSPTDEELIEEAGDNPKMGRFSKGTRLTSADIRRWVQTGSPLHPVSIDSPSASPDSAFSLHEILADDRIDILGDVSELLRSERFQEALPHIKPRYADLLTSLAAGETFRDIGRRWGMSREGVRQNFGRAVNAVRVYHKLEPYSDIPTLKRSSPRPERLQRSIRRAPRTPAPAPVPGRAPTSSAKPLSTPTLTPRSTMANKPTCAWPGCNRRARSAHAPLCQRDSLRAIRMGEEDPSSWGGMERALKPGQELDRDAYEGLAKAWEAYMGISQASAPTPSASAKSAAPAKPTAQPEPQEDTDLPSNRVVDLHSVPSSGSPNPMVRPLREVTHISDLLAHPGVRPLIELLGLDTEERAGLRLDDALGAVIDDLRSYAEGLKVNYEPSTYPELVTQVIELMLSRRLVDRIFGESHPEEPDGVIDEATLEHAHELVKLSHDQLVDIMATLEPIDVHVKGEDGATLYPHQMTALRHPVLLAFLRGHTRLLGIAMDYLAPPDDVAYLQSIPLLIPPGAEAPSEDALAQTILSAVLGALPEGTKVVGDDDACAPAPSSADTQVDPASTRDPNGDAP